MRSSTPFSPGASVTYKATSQTPNTPRRLRDGDEATKIRQEYFEKYVKMFKDAAATGRLLDWKDSNPDEPRVFGWYVETSLWTMLTIFAFSRPLNDEGFAIHPSRLSDAVMQYDIKLPSCPCATQETDPDVDHTYHIWVVYSPGSMHRGKVACGCKRHKQGCNVWRMSYSSFRGYVLNTAEVLLEDLWNNSGLSAHNYPRRPSLGPGK